MSNYARCLAHIALHFKISPIYLNEEQVLNYLYYLRTQHNTPSKSFFKHTIYGLRYAFRMYGLKELRAALPSLEQPKKLPVVLSKREVKLFLKAPKCLKHRLVLGMLYGCGLRCFELCNIQLKDLDFDREMLHVRQGKGRKDRYVPLSQMLIRGLKKYIATEHPTKWCFNGKNKKGNAVALSRRGVQWIVRQTRERSGINKEITSHSLRHSYATHLLEMGLDIITIKDLLGHACIQSTIVYLNVAKLGRQRAFSPLDKLYSQ